MALIPNTAISTLKSAADVKKVADSAVAIQEEMQVAAVINNAANTGEHSAIWQHPMSDALKTKLEGLGYTVKENTRAASPERQYIIEGF